MKNTNKENLIEDDIPITESTATSLDHISVSLDRQIKETKEFIKNLKKIAFQNETERNKANR